MQRNMSVVGLAVLTMGVLGNSMGMAMATEEAISVKRMDQLRQITGEVMELDVPEQILTLRESRKGLFFGERNQAFMVRGDTDITDGTAKLELEALKPGDHVEITYLEEEHGHRARFIIVTEPEPIE